MRRAPRESDLQSTCRSNLRSPYQGVPRKGRNIGKGWRIRSTGRATGESRGDGFSDCCKFPCWRSFSASVTTGSICAPHHGKRSSCDGSMAAFVMRWSAATSESASPRWRTCSRQHVSRPSLPIPGKDQRPRSARRDQGAAGSRNAGSGRSPSSPRPAERCFGDRVRRFVDRRSVGGGQHLLATDQMERSLMP